MFSQWYRNRKEKPRNGQPKVIQKRVLQRTSMDSGHIGIIPWRAGSQYPRNGQSQSQSRQSQKIFLTNSGTTSSRVYVTQHRPEKQQFYYVTNHHKSMPLLRLGTYTPKVIEGMSFSPQSVRSHETYFDIASPHIDKHHNEKSRTRSGSEWRPKKYEEKTGTVTIEDDEDDGVYIPRQELQIPMKGVVIAKVTDNQYGPLSTSTPRTPDIVLIKATNRADSDSAVDTTYRSNSNFHSVINVQ